MFHIVLFQPEIPPNTGNIIRLCANTGAQLHLIRPLGFDLDDRRLRRAGLDYHEWARVREYDGYDDFIAAVQPSTVFAFTTKAQRIFHSARFAAGDALLFGPETRGLPVEMLEQFPPDQRLRIPMTAEARSLNLSNAVAIAVYEAWRQSNFSGAL